MRLGLQIGVLVVTCSLGALALSTWISRADAETVARANTAGRHSLTLERLQTIEAAFGEWMTTTDLILASGETYLTEFASDQADRLVEYLERLGHTPLVGPYDRELETILQDVVRVKALTTRAAGVFGDDRPERINRILAQTDPVLTRIVGRVAELGTAVRQTAAREASAWQARQSTLQLMLWALSCCYVGVVLAGWYWVVATSVRPLRDLTDVARDAMLGHRKFLLRPHGATEIRQLTETVSRFVSGLETANAQLEQSNARMERTVTERTAQLVAANRTKDRFLASVSHEIRTPLAAIVGYAGLLGRTDVPEHDRRVWVGQLRRNAVHLSRLVDDFLDLSRFERDQVELRLGPHDLDTLVRDVVAGMRFLAEQKSLALHLEYQTDIPSLIDTDESRLRQILTNLIGNAVKFTERGEVRVVVRATAAHGQQPGQLEIAVIDTGVGLPEDAGPRLFSPYTQLARSGNRPTEGLGLGLTISRGLAERLGGEITVDSTLGRGSTFTVRLPITPRDTAWIRPDGVHGEDAHVECPYRLGCRLQGTRILLAEDGLDNQRILRFLLEEAGAEVSLAATGTETVETVRRMTGTQTPPDLILMDMRMPHMDGYQATGILRDEGWRRPIIALTSYAMPGDREKCLEAGCDAYLSKPVTPRQLTTVLAQWLWLSDVPADPPGGDDDAPRLGSSLAGDPRFAPLLLAYRQALPDCASAIELAHQARDEPALAAQLHGLAGSAGSHGFSKISMAARDCETLIRQHRGWHAVKTPMTKLTSLLRQAAPA